MMKTIVDIIKDSGYDYITVVECGVCNGCGAKGGVNFEKIMKALPYFNTEKGKKLFNDLHLLCNIHDLDYTYGEGFLDFIRANFRFAYNVYRLTYWTNRLARIIVFIIIFLGTTLFGYKAYNAED